MLRISWGINQRIMLGFLLVLLICLGITIFSVNSLHNVNQRFIFFNKASNETTLMLKVDKNASDLQRYILAFSNTEKNASITQIRELHQELVNDVGRLIAMSNANDNESLILLQQMLESVDSLSESISSLEGQRGFREQAIDLHLNPTIASVSDVINVLFSEIKNTYNAELSNKLWKVQLNVSEMELLSSRYFNKHEFRLRKQVVNTIDETRIYLNDIQSIILNNKKIQDHVENIIHGLAEVKKTFLQAVQADRDYLFLVNVVIAGESSELNSLSERLKNNYLIEQNVIFNDTKNFINFSQNVDMLLAFLGSFLAIVIAVITGRRISLPLTSITETFKKLVKGENITDIPGSLRKDEIGHLAKAANVFREKNEQTRELLLQTELFAKKLQDREFSLEDALTKAEAATLAKSQFLANMSHEIRTPMNAVLGMLQLAQSTSLTARQRDYIDKAHMSAKSLLGLLNDILDFSKMDADKLELDLHAFNLEELLRDLGTILSGSCSDSNKDVEIMFDCDTYLVKWFVGDRLRLQQILINLSSNALKFTEKGQVIISLKCIENLGKAQRIRFSVNDTGIGIDESQLSKIFNGFEQAEASTTRRFGGTGLGLVIVKRLVELMGGEIQVSSELGRGSHFWFEIILETQSLTPIVHTQNSLPKSFKVLVVDDNKQVGEILTRTVCSLGFHTDYVTSGSAALISVEKAVNFNKPYDIILMDWQMPGIDGIETSQQIRDQFGSVQPAIIMVSAFSRNILAEYLESGNAPFTHYLTKPVTPQQLVDAIHQAFVGKAMDVGLPEQKLSLPTQKALSGLHILVVEDNELNRQVVYELLTAVGAEIVLAFGGIDGVAAVIDSNNTFDLVIMDIQMPDMDGLEATRRIRANGHYNDLPILAMTANVSAADRVECLNAGMNDHIGKPIDMDELVPRILSLCGKGDPSENINDKSTLDNGVSDNGASDNDKSHELVEPFDTLIRRFGGNVQSYGSFLEGFQENINNLLATLAGHYIQKDRSAIKSSLHSVKGLAATMGARALALRVTDIEEQVKSEEKDLSLIINENSITDLSLLASGCVEELYRVVGIEQPLNDNSLTHVEEETSHKKNITSLGLSVDAKGEIEHILLLVQEGNLHAIASVKKCYEQASEEDKNILFDLKFMIEKLNFSEAEKYINSLLNKE